MVNKKLNNNAKDFNPEKLPLGELKLSLADTKGVRRQIPALDAHWIAREKPFGTYICMLSSYSSIKSDAALEEWQHVATTCLQDFQFLLHLKHHEFWSYMVHFDSAMAAIVTFLQRANPYYRLDTDDTNASNTALSNAKLLYSQLLNHVIRLIMRLLTEQESPTEWLAPEHHRTLLYNNYLISVPLLCDLVIAVGDGDPQNLCVLQTIFETVLRLQPDYIKDLQEALAFYENAFLSMQIQVDNEGCEGAGGGALLDPAADTPYDDVVLFALDCAYTLRLLLQLCPDLLQACEQLKLVQSIANFYDLTVPTLYRNIYMINARANSLRWLNEARQQFLNVVRCITRAQVEGGRGQQLVELLQECLSAQTFVVDYQRQYPVEHDIAVLLKTCPKIKNYKVDFVIAGYQKTLASCTSGVLADDQFSNPNSDDEPEDAPQEATATAVATVSTVVTIESGSNSNRDIDLEVTAVLDVLPDLGMGFIRRLLTRYDNSEQAIAAILDDNLPPDLIHMDRQEVFIPADPQDKLQRQTGVRHYNVHDGDRYDVLTQDNPQCIIKQGKGLPGAARNAEQLLDDKRDISQLKQRYQQYALVEETPDEATGAEYDDEYDDSYEALNDGQAPPVSLLRAKLQQASAANNNAYEAQDASDDEPDDDDESEDEQQKGRRGADFCENPEVVRARYQQRQQAKYGGRQQHQQQHPSDVVGAPKGQGQTQQTTRNRGQKEAHKSSRANHNRKAGAAFKRSKGMLS
ncbi:hypothetical protein KR044_002143 [Drosophila immigrans]|nr:hypothetical protein KR044_002143 [Drosophila immigrans]